MWVSSACFVSSFSCGGYVAAMQTPWPGQPAAGGQREATMRDLSDRLACTGQGVCPGSANGDLEVTIATCPRSRCPATRDYSHLLKGQWDRAPGAPESTEVVLLWMASHPRCWSRPCASVEGTAGLRGAGCGCWARWPGQSPSGDQPQEEVSPRRGQKAARSVQRWISLQNGPCQEPECHGSHRRSCWEDPEGC